MDPQVALHQLLDLLSDPANADREEVMVRFSDLALWIERGGYMPTLIRQSGRYIVPTVLGDE